jgi:hemerythrin-like domain-containing protein
MRAPRTVGTVVGDVDFIDDKRMERTVSTFDAHTTHEGLYPPSTDADDELFDGREMTMVHDVLRREFGLLPGVVAAIEPAELDSQRASTIAWHIDWLVKFLHHHHSTEDHDIWPLLAERCGHHELTTRMESEHQEVASCVDAIVKALEVWEAQRSVESRDALEHALRELIPPLKAHLTDEEQHVVPLMERYVGANEVRRAVEAGLTRFPPGEITHLVGMLMYEGHPEMVDRVLAAMPPDIAAVIRVDAPMEFVRHCEQVHGTRTPPRSNQLSNGSA